MLCFVMSCWNSSHISSWSFRVDGAVVEGRSLLYLLEPIEEVMRSVGQNWSAAPQAVLVRKKDPWSCAGAGLGM